MTLNEIYNLLGFGGAGVFVVIILSLVKIKPLEISVWHWIARKVGKAFNGETLDRIEDVEKTLTNHIEEDKEKEALQHRTVILRFADEMYEHKYHSRDHFEEVLERAKKYKLYCDAHPDFENGRTETAVKIIQEKYEACMKKGDFAKESKHE